MTLLFISILSLAVNSQMARSVWTGTVYIKADGSIDPSDAPIITYDNMTYTLIGNITSSADGIVVERDNVIINGAGCILQGAMNGCGVDLSGRSNVTVMNMRIQNFEFGIFLYSTLQCAIYGNTLTNNRYYGIGVNSGLNNTVFGNILFNNINFGISIWGFSHDVHIQENKITSSDIAGISVSDSYNITIFKNEISENVDGILIYNSTNNEVSGNNITQNRHAGIEFFLESINNVIFHNNFVNNAFQALTNNNINYWDDGYPSGGNYWSDYTSIDLYNGPHQNETGSDGIGDTPYIIDEYNQDRYPLVHNESIPWGDWQHYHNYTEIVNTLLSLNNTFPNIVDVFSIGKSWQSRDIYCIRLTNESNTDPKPKVLFVGYHHARELISAELPLYFVSQAAINFGTNETITYMLNYSEIYVIPALNVDGFDSVRKNEWQRKNAHPFDEDGDGLFDEDPPDDEDGDGYIEDLYYWDGINYYFIRWEGIDDDGDGLKNEDWIGGVDLNRNYDYQWQGGSSDPRSEVFKGTAPFSEPETQALRNLALEHDFMYALSFHSGAELILYPWGYTYNPPPDVMMFQKISQDLSSITGGTIYMQASSLYISYGLWDDWMYGNRSTFAITCEIYTNNSAWQYEPGPEPKTWWEKGVFQYFNPDANQIKTVIQRWLPVFTYITNRSITEFQHHNIAITDVTALKIIVGQGYTASINVTVVNQSGQTETFNVTVYVNTTAIETRQETLVRGTLKNLTFTWNTTDFAKGNYTIWAYAELVPGEIDMTDNICANGIIKVGVPGDVNPFDGYVGVDDIFTIAWHFGTEPDGPPNPNGRYYDPNLDITDDYYVGVDDIFIAASHFGEEDPP